MTKNGRKKKFQDIVKEDFLFCPDCEKYFSVLETYCSIRLGRYSNPRYYKNFRYIRRINGIEFIEFKELDIRIFNLFIYSIVWRISVSDNFAFGGFQLKVSDEENIRQHLQTFTSGMHEDLINNISSMTSQPNHSHVFLRPRKKLRPPNSMLSAASRNALLHQIHLVDYLLFYATQKNIFHKFSLYDNNRINGNVIVGIVDENNWIRFNDQMLNEAI